MSEERGESPLESSDRGAAHALSRASSDLGKAMHIK